MEGARGGRKVRPAPVGGTGGGRPRGGCTEGAGGPFISAAGGPATGADAASARPKETATTMNLFLAEFAAGLPADVHAVLVLDGAGWHGARALAVPPNVTLVPLPPYSPELNRIEELWRHVKYEELPVRSYRALAALRTAVAEALNTHVVPTPLPSRSTTDLPEAA